MEVNKLLISYVLTTYNKSSYLKTILEYTVPQIDYSKEELIIVDGQSKDDTLNILEVYKSKGQIQNFTSEKDCGESEGTNKAILNAKGKYIKILTDDDPISISIVRKAVQFMEENTEIDLLGCEGASISSGQKINFKGDLKYFGRYKSKGKGFVLTGIGYIIRRKSLGKLGLFNTAYKMVDIEYSLRNTSNPNVIIAFTNTPYFINIVNSNSNSIKFNSVLTDELYRLQRHYKSDNSLNLLIWYCKRKLETILSKFRKNKIQQSAEYTTLLEEAIKKLKEFEKEKIQFIK